MLHLSTRLVSPMLLFSGAQDMICYVGMSQDRGWSPHFASRARTSLFTESSPGLEAVLLVMGNDTATCECSQPCAREQVSAHKADLTSSLRSKEVFPVVHCFLLRISDVCGFIYLMSQMHVVQSWYLGSSQQLRNPSPFLYTGIERLRLKDWEAFASLCFPVDKLS